MKNITRLFVAFAIVSALLTIHSCQKGDGCGTVSGLATNGITGSTVNLKWNAAGNAASYVVQYRKIGQPTWLNTASLSETVQLVGLDPNSNYECQVKTLCAQGTSGFTSSLTFKTTGCPAGYEGINCDIKSSEKFAGIYLVNDTANFPNSPPYLSADTMIVTTATNPNIIIITGFAQYPKGLPANLSGNNFTVPDTLVQTAILGGSGSFSGNNISYTYSYKDPSNGSTVVTGFGSGSK